MATSKEEMQQGHNYRRYEEGDFVQDDWQAEIFDASWSHKCPTYIQRTPPCQGSCPAGEDIRGWLDIVRGIEKPSGEMSMQEYAFLRATDANPFPSMMGRVCPAPCQDGCNRNNVEDYVGINADTAIENDFKYTAGADTGKKVAIIGGGPAGMTAAYQLRRMGHGATVFEERAELGGMMRYGIPGYRIPRDKLAAENQRILDLGVETRMNTRVGRDVSLSDVEKEFDAVVWALGCWTGRSLPVDGWDNTPNCVDALSFLEAFNNGRMKVTGKKLVCIGGGDTSIDVVSVARRIGFNADAGLPEDILNNDVVQDQALADSAEPVDATLTSLFTKDKMMAAEHEITDALKEGVSIFDGVMPLEVIVGDDGRATGLKVCDCTMDGMKPVATEGTERVIEADIIVAAIGQGGDMAGLEDMANERNMIDADKNYQVPDKPGHFVAGDIVRPHLLTTAIGQASIAAESINSYLMSEKMARRPKVDKHHFSLSDKLHEAGLDPDDYDKTSTLGTSEENFAVHNFDDRSQHEIINYDELFLGHFEYEERYKRDEDVPSADEVLGHFHERLIGLTEETAVKEATRCMSCGMCFECDNCVIFCPQDAVYRVKKDQSTMGRYVATDYSKCIGCHICADVCPTGYIDMGMGE